MGKSMNDRILIALNLCGVSAICYIVLMWAIGFFPAVFLQEQWNIVSVVNLSYFFFLLIITVSAVWLWVTRYGSPSGIGGWLILPAIGLVGGIYKLSTEAVIIGVLQLPIAWSYWIIVAIQMAAVCVVAILFFIRHRFAKVAVPLLVLGNALFAWYVARDDVSEPGISHGELRAVVGVVISFVCIMYFVYSKRVKATFVK